MPEYSAPDNQSVDFALESYTAPDHQQVDFELQAGDVLAAPVTEWQLSQPTATATGEGTATVGANTQAWEWQQPTATVAQPQVVLAETQEWQFAQPTAAPRSVVPGEVPVEWRVTRDGTDVETGVFDVDPVVDTANPFGDYCVFKLDDRGGQKFENYERGTRVDVAVSNNAGITFDNRFTGYVVERRETEQSGADVLEVEAYSFDQFLRRNTVTNDQTGNLISEALADIIQTDTAVSYVAGNVTVGDDQELTRGYQGVAVEEALRDLAFKSQNENFGVNDNLEFFFRPRETIHIDRGVDNTQWFNYDIPELGKEAINEVEVWFDDGDRSVIVDDGTDKLDLQDNLGLPSPGTQRAELNRPLITNISDAEDIGRKYLTFRNATLSGTVTTFGLYDAEPGDTIDITIDARGIDAEFVIAAIEYRWGVDQTILTIVEKRGDVDDILTEISDSVQRVEMNGANRDAPSNRITTTNATAIVSLTADADGNTPDADRFVNDGRNAIRDAWTGDAPPDITTLVVGDDNSGLSRTNTALGNQTNSATVSQTLPDAKTVEFSASITQTGVAEIGLEAAGGTLITRATFDTPVDLDGTVTVTLTVSNDDSVSRGVLTNDGQTAIRDVLADNSPARPTDYAYGSDNTAVSETDTALGNEVVSTDLLEVQVQFADSADEFRDISPDFAEDVPLGFDELNGRLEQQRVTFFEEAEDADNLAPIYNATAELSGDEGRELDQAGAFVEIQFTPDHTIPVDELGVGYMFNTYNSFDGEILQILDGEQINSVTYSGSTTQNSFSGFATSANDAELEAGTTHTWRVEAGTVNSGQFVVDMIYAFDSRENINFSPTFDAGTASFNGPEFFAEQQRVEFDTASTRRLLDEASASQQWNNTDNNQYIELSNDGGSTFIRTTNSETASATFASPSRQVQTAIALSRYSGGTVTTPTVGQFGQFVELHILSANIDSTTSEDIGTTTTRGIVQPNTITGETIREAGVKSNGTLLTRHVLAEFTVESGQRLASDEELTITSDN